jgi:mannosyl-3-phosphoglycerate phosphatase
MRPQLVVFTDLDGCLLDEETHRFDGARGALLALRRAGVPLVLCTSKTRAEVAPLQRRLGHLGPYVFENGSGIVIPLGRQGWGAPLVVPRRGGPLLVPLGIAYRKLVGALAEIAAETDLRLRGFSDWSVPEIGARTGLPIEDARRARAREFDEPFVIEGAGANRLEVERRLTEAAEGRGLRVTHGGRFYHLTGRADKGRAVRQLLALRAGGAVSIALGDAANDLTMLEAVDEPVILPRGDGTVNEVLAYRLPRARRATRAGPPGWNDAVLALLAGARPRKPGPSPTAR